MFSQIPSFRKAFDEHVNDLAESAYEVLRTNNGTTNLKLRLLKYRSLDKRIINAKKKLVDHIGDADEVPIADLLR